MIRTSRHHVSTTGQGEVHDLTAAVAEAVRASGVREGLVTVFVAGSTAAISTMEFEPGAIADLARLFEQLAPRHADYRHHLTWGDDNGSSHARSTVVGPSLSIPCEAGRPVLGTWQQIVLLEFDTRGRTREVVIQVQGE